VHIDLDLWHLVELDCKGGDQAGPKLCGYALEPGRFPSLQGLQTRAFIVVLPQGRVGWSGLVGLISRHRGLGSWLCGVGAI
jgi:hypothetical protein